MVVALIRWLAGNNFVFSPLQTKIAESTSETRKHFNLVRTESESTSETRKHLNLVRTESKGK
jgi:hypothetical protein